MTAPGFYTVLLAVKSRGFHSNFIKVFVGLRVFCSFPLKKKRKMNLEPRPGWQSFLTFGTPQQASSFTAFPVKIHRSFRETEQRLAL